MSLGDLIMQGLRDSNITALDSSSASTGATSLNDTTALASASSSRYLTDARNTTHITLASTSNATSATLAATKSTSSIMQHSMNGTYTVPANGTGPQYANDSSCYMTTHYTGTVTTVCANYSEYYHPTLSVLGTLTPTASGCSMLDVMDTSAYTGPTPACTIKPQDCSSLSRLWSSAKDVYENSISRASLIWVTLADPLTALEARTIFAGTTQIHSETQLGTDSAPTLTIGHITLPPGVDSQYTIAIPSQPQASSPLTVGPGSMWSYYDPYPTYSGPIGDYDGPKCGKLCGQYRVQLLYFPTSVESRASCNGYTTDAEVSCPHGTYVTLSGNRAGGGQAFECSYLPYNGSTTTTDSGPYVVSEGRTFYANRAYMSINKIYAANGCSMVSQVHSQVLITAASSQIYSILFDHYGPNGLGISFNFDDLNYPIPPAVYFENCYGSGGGCDREAHFCDGDTINNVTYGGPCDIVVDGAYKPNVVIPQQVQTLDPAWASCAYDLNGIFDPPKTLQVQTTLDQAQAPVTLAAPASTAPPVTPVQTTATMTSVIPTTAAVLSTPLSDGTHGSVDGEDPSATAKQSSIDVGDRTSEVETTVPVSGGSAVPIIPDTAKSSTATFADQCTDQCKICSNIQRLYCCVVSTTQGTVDAVSILSEAAASLASLAAIGTPSVNSDPYPISISAAALSTETINTKTSPVSNSYLSIGAIILYAGGFAQSASSQLLNSGTDIIVVGSSTMPLSGFDDPVSADQVTSTPGSNSYSRTATTATAEYQGVLTGLDGHVLTVVQQGSSVVVVQDGTSATTIPVGAVATVRGNTIGVPTMGVALFRGSSITFSMISQSQPPPAIVGATFTAPDGHTATIVH
ncbi:hypothetical protein LTR56_011491 [Elasticomyces elasticus]|nr:hypothetical protein LTR56_011491 [Elasticomyces elasticus]KAK3655915.1 hypothetical protein LTR22_009924 [Elasticomyces elasticus]KAK4921413.1 hypothetical protein LTR49_011067 [Elasticomyces elasticus]KAK5760113.1 hypothetical protein LTS12_009844 [Elasticomyces elasticus]